MNRLPRRGGESARVTRGLEVDHCARARRLIVRDIRVGRRQGVDRLKAHVTDDADDGRGVEAALTDANQFSER